MANPFTQAPKLSGGYTQARPAKTLAGVPTISQQLKSGVSSWYGGNPAKTLTPTQNTNLPTAGQAPASSTSATGDRYAAPQAAPTGNRYAPAAANGIFTQASAAPNMVQTAAATANKTNTTDIPTTAPWSMGGTEYSPNDLQTMLNNPYVFAQEWLKGRGMDNPTMLARLGDFPEAAAPLIFMMLGDKPVGDTINANTSASMLRRLLYQQTTPGDGGIDAKSLINKLLSYGANDTGKDLLGASLGTGTPNEQVQFLNDLLNVSTVNASPYFANPLKQALQYQGNTYLGSQLDANGGKQSYSEWLRNQGLFDPR